MDKMTTKKYVEMQGEQCPHCASANIHAGTVTAESGSLWQTVSCRDCGKSWDDEYSLIGYVEHQS